MNSIKGKRFKTAEVIRQAGVSSGRLRYWESLGIVTPKYRQGKTKKFRSYSQEDIHRAVLVKTLGDIEKCTLQAAIKRLQEEGWKNGH